MGIKPLELESDLEGSTYCRSCHEEFGTKDELDIHHATTCKKPPRRRKYRFRCRMCIAPEPRFLTRFLLADHIDSEHIAKKGKKKKEEAEESSTGEAPAEEVNKQNGPTKRGNRRAKKRNR